MLQTWWAIDKNGSVFFGCGKTQQALKEVQKGNEWYRKDFGVVAVLPVSLENSKRRKLESKKLG